MHAPLALEYTEPLLRAVVRAWWRRTIGVGYFVALAFLAGPLGFLWWSGDRTWLVGALGAALAFGTIFAAALYIVQLRGTIARFRAMGAPVATLALGDASFTMRSGAGSATVQWSAVTEVWRFPAFWLLVFSKSQFVTLPLAGIPPDAQAFILERASAAAGSPARR